MAGKPDDYLITTEELAETIRAGQQAYREGKLTMPEQTTPAIQPDPHGMVALFAERMAENLPHMDPRAATEQALATVKRHLDASEFIDLSSKSSTERAYMRVDKRPETHKRRKGGGGMR